MGWIWPRAVVTNPWLECEQHAGLLPRPPSCVCRLHVLRLTLVPLADGCLHVPKPGGALQMSGGLIPAPTDTSSVRRPWGIGHNKDFTSASRHRNERVGPHRNLYGNVCHDVHAYAHWKQPGCPSAGDWVTKLRASTLWTLKHAAPRVDLKDTRVEISRRKRLCVHVYEMSRKCKAAGIRTGQSLGVWESGRG